MRSIFQMIFVTELNLLQNTLISRTLRLSVNSKLEEFVKTEILINHHSIGSAPKIGATFLFSVLATVGIGYTLNVNTQLPEFGFNQQLV